MRIQKGIAPASLLAGEQSLFRIHSATARHEIARRAMNGIACRMNKNAATTRDAKHSESVGMADVSGVFLYL